MSQSTARVHSLLISDLRRVYAVLDVVICLAERVQKGERGERQEASGVQQRERERGGEVGALELELLGCFGEQFTAAM